MLSLLVLESELLLDGFHQALAKLSRVYGKYGMPAVVEELEMRACLGSECDALFRQPPLELGTLHGILEYTIVITRAIGDIRKLSRYFPNRRTE